MLNGLHIGLAAWVNQQRNSDSFAVYPALPIVVGLVDLGAIQNVQDLAKAYEFARLVNFIPRLGQVADLFSSSTILWQLHRDLLRQMDFATNPWTGAEQAQFQAAQDVLYTAGTSGLPGPSPRLLLYEEMRNTYRDLSRSGTPEEIVQAMADWVVLGYKQAVEDALEVIGRLTHRSARQRAQQEVSMLNDIPPGVGLRFYDDLEFAPTYFGPISAICRDTWVQAKVTFAELDRAVAKSPATDQWDLSFANRTGDVTFDYAVLTCIRPWYTPSLYQADDWKLRDADTLASQGNGTAGLMPAYVDAVYLISVQNVTVQPVTPGPRPVIQRERLVLSQLTVARKSPMHSVTRTGVMARVINASLTPRLASTSNDTSARRLLLREEAATHRISNVPAVSGGKIRKLSAITQLQRSAVALAFINGTALPPGTPVDENTSAEIYVAGFGCRRIPFAPNPNANYHW